MKSWQEELFSTVADAQDEHEVFRKVEASARALGFTYCAYGLRIPLHFTSPKTIVLNNYSPTWQRRYEEEGYVSVDPTVLHGRRSQTPLVWSDQVFASVQKLWDEAQSFGLRIGWAQSTLDVRGGFGMLSLARSGEPLSKAELAAQEVKMRWLAHIAHLTLSRIFVGRQNAESHPHLTSREIEVLKWTADGKTSSEISDILVVSENTVNFHIKNAVLKLKTANKTAATVRAAVLGLLG
ncbi:autoinducer binding domain-containing protein [Rhodoferax sp. GW822-FHT02A01]|uniref:autoinducer binding domain-containing protein n=1 Tax=Rhodoferax sp. GW822-FHT02A01 TaxID=3141537 RepID=UPI00315DEC8C